MTITNKVHTLLVTYLSVEFANIGSRMRLYGRLKAKDIQIHCEFQQNKQNTVEPVWEK